MNLNLADALIEGMDMDARRRARQCRLFDSSEETYCISRIALWNWCSTGVLGSITHLVVFHFRMTVVLYHGSSSWFRLHGNGEAVACLYVEFGEVVLVRWRSRRTSFDAPLPARHRQASRRTLTRASCYRCCTNIPTMAACSSSLTPSSAGRLS